MVGAVDGEPVSIRIFPCSKAIYREVLMEHGAQALSIEGSPQQKHQLTPYFPEI